MKLIPLTRGLFAQVDDEDYDYLNQWKWCAMRGKNCFYAVRRGRGGKLTIMHRVIMKTPDNMLCDHAFHNGLDNRKFVEVNGVLKANLRNCTNAENLMNKNPSGKSEYLGVSYNRHHIRAMIRISGKQTHLGYFKTEKEAAAAYDIAAMKYHGEFANLNFKSTGVGVKIPY